MKTKLCLTALMLTFSLVAKAQDLIVKHDGTELEVKVLEIGTDAVKYKRWSNQDGPTFSESKSKIFMIKYANGEKESFAEAADTSASEPASMAERVQKLSMENVQQKERTPKHEKSFQIGIQAGFQPSFSSMKYGGEVAQVLFRAGYLAGVYVDWYPSLYSAGMVEFGLDYSAQGGSDDINANADYLRLNTLVGLRGRGYYAKTGPRMGFLVNSSLGSALHNSFIFGWLIGVGWSGKHFDAGIMYEWGWTNYISSAALGGGFSSSNSIIGLTASYRF